MEKRAIGKLTFSNGREESNMGKLMQLVPVLVAVLFGIFMGNVDQWLVKRQREKERIKQEEEKKRKHKKKQED